MNRLSEGAIELNDVEVFNNCSYSCYINIADALNQLKAYEDTGLELEEIRELIKAYNKDSTIAAHYEHLEEQGLLIKLPCKVGDMVIILFNEFGEIFTTEGWRVEEITIIDNDVIFSFRCYETDDEEERSLKDFGKTVFITREEAEKVLEGMKK